MVWLGSDKKTTKEEFANKKYYLKSTVGNDPVFQMLTFYEDLSVAGQDSVTVVCYDPFVSENTTLGEIEQFFGEQIKFQ